MGACQFSSPIKRVADWRFAGAHWFDVLRWGNCILSRTLRDLSTTSGTIPRFLRRVFTTERTEVTEDTEDLDCESVSVVDVAFSFPLRDLRALRGKKVRAVFGPIGCGSAALGPPWSMVSLASALPRRALRGQKISNPGERGVDGELSENHASARLHDRSPRGIGRATVWPCPAPARTGPRAKLLF